MTRTAGCPLDGAPWARGGAGSGVVDSRSALYPTTVRVLSLVHVCVPQKRLAPRASGIDLLVQWKPPGVDCNSRRVRQDRPPPGTSEDVGIL